MNNVVHNNFTNTFGVNDFFNPFYDNMTAFFYELLIEDWKDLNSETIDKQSIMLSLKEEFRKKIIDLSKKVLIYEFHESFKSEDKEDESKYYRSFNKLLENPGYCNNLLHKYPVLNEIYITTQANLLQNSFDLINRYIADVKELEVKFNKKLGLLKSVSINLGDTHRNGNSVAVIRTEKERIIYKPRSLKADSIYTQVLNFFNRFSSEKLQSPMTVDKEDYGWQEFISYQECFSENDFKKFYKKLGMHLGFVYAFQGSDFHYENIIAKGSDPYLIDLETLFQPTLDFMESEEKQIETSFIDFLNKTVYKSLFFNNTAYPEEENLRDACALSNTNEQLMEEEEIQGRGTDRISLKKQVQFMEQSYNLPSKDGKTIEIFGYEKYFIEGFKEVYIFIMDNKSPIQSILNSSSDFQVRVIVRPTHVYAKFLTSLLHPKYLKESNERYRVLSFFEESYKKFSFFKKASKFEKMDMYHGDIPYFTCYFKNKDVYSSKGVRIDSRLINKSTLEEIENRLKTLTNEDCSYQISLINMALTALRANSKSKNDEKLMYDGDFKQPLNYLDLNKLLLTETEKILDERLSFDQQIQWISLSIHQTGQVVTGPVNYNLYDGIGGIGLYLSYYYDKYHLLNKDFIDSFINTIQILYRTTKIKNNFSAYHGITSYIYILDKMVECGHVDKEDAIKVYLEYCDIINKDIKSILASDFIGGLAGVLKVLTQLYKSYKLELFKQTANVVYDQLVSNAQTQDDLVFWKFDISKSYGLTGFSHGQTGICYALSEYYTIIKNDSEEKKNRVLDIIGQALNYEDQYYDSIRENWLDNRDGKFFSDPFWCHGAAGILLGRVKIQVNLDANIKVRYIREALSTTLKLGNQHSKGNSLCHGTLGNLDILIEIRDFFKGTDLELLDNSIELWISNYLKSMNDVGWQNGFNKDISNAGLMIGKTGQLYTLLRYNDPGLPCILSLS